MSLFTVNEVEGMSNPPSSIQHIILLVVEPDRDCRDILKIFFEGKAVTVVTVGTVRQALEILHAIVPDLIIAELALPGEDGGSLLERVKMLERQRQVPIPAIAFTSYAMVGDRERALSMGFCRHVAKPYDLYDLAAIVLDVLVETRKISETDAKYLFRWISEGDLAQ